MMHDFEKALSVSFDPSFMEMSMQLWRDSTDLKVPVHDDFKIHFMENRYQILRNFENTATAWSMVVRSMVPVQPTDDCLKTLATKIEEFHAWASAELSKLEKMEIQESVRAGMDELMTDPEIRSQILGMFKKFPPKPASEG